MLAGLMNGESTEVEGWMRLFEISAEQAACRCRVFWRRSVHLVTMCGTYTLEVGVPVGIHTCLDRRSWPPPKR